MSANSSIGEIVTTTLENYRSTLTDNVLNHNALTQRLLAKGNVKPLDGGRVIYEDLMYAENSTVMWYSGYEQLDTSPQEVLDSASFDWKQMAGVVTVSGLEEMKNSGESAKYNLVRSRIMVLEKSLQNELAQAVYYGTDSDGKKLEGLALLVADDPTTGTVGGINRASYSFWQNQYSATAATSSGNILSRMNSMWLSCLRGTDKPDLIVTDADMYTDFLEALQPLQRFTTGDAAKAGFESVKYMTADVVYDDQCTTKRMFFLNTDYIFLRPHSRRNFTALPDRASFNQDAFVMPTVWMGAMTCSNCSLQGVIIKT